VFIVSLFVSLYICRLFGVICCVSVYIMYIFLRVPRSRGHDGGCCGDALSRTITQKSENGAGGRRKASDGGARLLG
jgi:hypothetical protein